MSSQIIFTPNSTSTPVVTMAQRSVVGVRFASLSAARTRKNATRLLGLSALVLSMAACNTIPKADMRPVLVEPNLPIEQAYGAFDNQTVSTAEQPSVAGQRWQDFYSDERLKGLIALGLQNNKDFESARLAIEKARAQYQITDIRDLPTIDGSAGYSRRRQGS